MAFTRCTVQEAFCQRRVPIRWVMRERWERQTSDQSRVQQKHGRGDKRAEGDEEGERSQS